MALFFLVVYVEYVLTIICLNYIVSEEVTQIPINETETETETETEAEVSIGTEIPDLDIIDEIQNQEAIPSYECTHDDPSVSSTVFGEADDHGEFWTHVFQFLYETFYHCILVNY